MTQSRTIESSTVLKTVFTVMEIHAVVFGLEYHVVC
jgi:hypothetical protein